MASFTFMVSAKDKDIPSFRRSSAVEQLTVNQLAAGSNPAVGAYKILSHTHGVAFNFTAPTE